MPLSWLRNCFDGIFVVAVLLMWEPWEHPRVGNGEGKGEGQEAASSGQLGGLLGQAGSVELVVGDCRESESYGCRQVMKDLQN